MIFKVFLGLVQFYVKICFIELAPVSLLTSFPFDQFYFWPVITDLAEKQYSDLKFRRSKKHENKFGRNRFEQSTFNPICEVRKIGKGRSGLRTFCKWPGNITSNWGCCCCKGKYAISSSVVPGLVVNN